MSHKRVSQLTGLTAAEIAGGDLFYVIDVSAKEGKKTTVDDLGAYLNASASFSVVNADTASYVLGTGVHGTVTSSLTALSAGAATSASWASSSVSSSWANTASFAINATAAATVSASWASSSISSSWANVAGTALTATTAASLIYPNSSTASYAMRAPFADSSSYAQTASYVSNTVASVATASYSLRGAYSDASFLSDVALELSFPNQSTASYAMVAENFSYNHLIDYGIFLATTQSISASQLDLVNVSSSLGVPKQTDVRAVGTVIVPYTSSIVVNESLSLVIKSRDDGSEEIIDVTPIYFDVSRTVNLWDNLMSGSLKIPYVLEGSASLLGNYMVFVTGSSSKIRIEPTRTNRFNLASISDTLTASPAEEPLFQVSPEGLVLITFYTGSHLGPFTDYRNGMLSTGSTTIDDVSVRNQAATSIRYVWSLPNLRILNCGQNMITSLTSMPDTMVSLSCDTCSITTIASLVNTTMSYFNCGNNSLTNLPALPTSLSYLNCSVNNLTSISGLPDTMSYFNASENLIDTIPGAFPYGLTHLYLGSNQLPSMFVTLPDSLVTMSVFENSLLSLTTTFPDSLGWIEAYSTGLSSIPTLPASLIYLDIHSCSLSQISIDNICSQSVVGGLSNGTLNLRGNGTPYASTITDYVFVLQGLGWNVTYDGV